MIRATAAEFQKSFGKWNKTALGGKPVVITAHGKDRLVMMSHADWEELRRDADAYRRVGSKAEQVECAAPDGFGYEDPEHKAPARVSRINLVAVSTMQEMVENGLESTETPPEFGND